MVRARVRELSAKGNNLSDKCYLAQLPEVKEGVKKEVKEEVKEGVKRGVLRKRARHHRFLRSLRVSFGCPLICIHPSHPSLPSLPSRFMHMPTSH